MVRKTAKKTQKQAFIDKAIELGIDVDEAEFDASLRRITKVRPSDSKANRKKDSGSDE